ncbi:MAG: DUF692 family multinuclear iron-containing protein, partial [Pseudomonadota bacterium]
DRPLLIDAHDRAVANQVWQLYADLITHIGPRPTLVEWDNDVPAWPELFTEAQRAEAILSSKAGAGAKSRAA